MFNESVMWSNHLTHCKPLLLLPSIFPSISIFFSELALRFRWLKYLSFSFTSSLLNEYSFLISFRIEWFDLLALQGTLKSPLQHHNSKRSVLWCSGFLMNQLSHSYMTTGEKKHKKHSFYPIDICWQNVSFVRVFLLFNMLSMFVKVSFQGASVLISWKQSLFTVILEPKKIVCHSFHFSPSICLEVIGPDAVTLVFWMLSFKPVYSLSSFTFIKRLFIPASLSTIRVVLLFAYLRLLVFLPAILIPACDSSNLAFQMMYCAYKLNKQVDNIHPCHTPFPILKQSVIPYLVLNVSSWSAYRLLKRKVRWSGTLISLTIFHSLLWYT